MLLQSGTITTNTSTTGKQFKGGDLYVTIAGSLGGGTLVLQASHDNGTSYTSVIDTDNPSLAVGAVIVRLPDCMVRLTLTGATSPTISYTLTARSPI